MLAITSKDFWEVIDRGTNFDYLDDARKAQLREFFGWFGRPRGDADRGRMSARACQARGAPHHEAP